MDSYNSYSREDFLDYGDEKVDIFIQNDKIYVVSAPKKIHAHTTSKLSCTIQSELDKYKTDQYYFDGYGSADVQLFNYANCCSTFSKQPDFSFDIFPPGERRYPSIVGVVAKSNENFKLLLDEIECYLNDYTHIQYVIGIIFLDEGAFKIRFLVAERKSPQIFFEKDEKEIFKNSKS